MIINGKSLLALKPLEPMLDCKVKEHGVSHGLAEVGYDIRIKQEVKFSYSSVIVDNDFDQWKNGKFCIASTIERFQMPPNLVGIVHDKSTWARRGLSVFNTVIEPSWNGFLTLELVYHGNEELHIPAGSGIAQVIFHEIAEPAHYDGKYQGQEDRPIAAILES
jgi:dCTP deaminase